MNWKQKLIISVLLIIFVPCGYTWYPEQSWSTSVNYSYLAEWNQPVTMQMYLSQIDLNPILIELNTSTDGIWTWDIGDSTGVPMSCLGFFSFKYTFDPYHPDFSWPLEEGKTWERSTCLMCFTHQVLHAIPEFIWPDHSGSGSGSWYAALLTPDLSAIVGTYGHMSFFWQE